MRCSKHAQWPEVGLIPHVYEVALKDNGFFGGKGAQFYGKLHK